MAYSNRVQAERDNAHDTATANKIIDMMQKLKLNNDNTTACRWIWELIQNAKDVVNITGLVNIKISFEEEKHRLLFSHDGKHFTTKNMVHLISQVSSKERNQSENIRVTGKFGTGFLTTHLLSEQVIIDAILEDEGEKPKKIQVMLDRSGKTKEQVMSSVKNSFEQLEFSEEVEQDYLINQYGFDTCFCYELDNEGIETAKNGLNSLYVSVPYIFAFLEQIDSIVVNDAISYKRGNVARYGDMFIHTIECKENGNKSIRNILTSSKNDIDIAFPVTCLGDDIIVEPYPDKVPKLFCDFPLVGTEDFSFPVVINSSRFNLNEPRNGIFLTDKINEVIKENKELMQEATSLFKKLLDCAATNGWTQVYNIVCVPRQIEKEWISKEWFKENIVDICKEYIKEAEIIDTESNERKPLFDFFDEQDVFIIGDASKEIREQVWNLTKYIYPSYIVKFTELHNWYTSLWPDCRNFNIKKLIEKIECWENLNNLQKSLNDINSIDWLNMLYEVIAKVTDKNDYFNFRIFPNQNGQFCYIQDLYFDDGIEEVYKDVLLLLNHECKGRLLDKRLELPKQFSCETYNHEKLFEEIIEAFNNDEPEYRKAMGKMIVLYDTDTKNDKEHIALVKLLYSMFASELPDAYEVNKIDKAVLEKVKNYWCTELANAVSACESVETLNKVVTLPDGYDIWKWVREFVEYLETFKYKNLFEKSTKPILPNQNGFFKNVDSLFLDSGDIDDIFKDILLEIGNDIRDILLPIDIYFELPDSRVKSLKDIAQNVVDYVKCNQGKMKNQDSTVIDNFNRLYLWINDNEDKAQIHFREILENKHWLYNDIEIAKNMKKAEKYDDLLKRYDIKDEKDLEKVLKIFSNQLDDEQVEELEVSEEMLIQYGISSEEDFSKAVALNVFGENFVHVSEGDSSKFEYVKTILERSKKAIFDYLDTLEEYDVSNPVEVSKTIFVVKKLGKELVLIMRPSDYGQVILYYGLEKDILDFEKEYELWVEDGKTEPQQITFGKMLKLTGINKIPLRKVR